MSSTDGEYIGTESCINDVNHHDVDDMNIEPGSPVVKKQSSSRKKRDKREFPPPIPLLAGTYNISSHMQWQLKRYTTSDGRLILREEKARNHHFFRSHRANGRLILQLVPLTTCMFPTDSLCVSAHHHDIREQVEEVEAATSPSQTGRVSGADDGLGDESHNALETQGLPRRTNCNLNCGRVSSASSCLFEMPAAVHPVRTVRAVDHPS